ncbi:LacI family DNA-binding transcriptional regulator [Alloscardovia omnicolens]|uniref:LacI family DNA-binding transcriptional regulator n=1 Tax=Alloscardovia omnicolens TaxID=419015 RepID=UPI00254CD690|nr:LacI family DNA-binding transcriptional regulator [Alloscardovia omnicolens]MDK6445419.1 LacI family DNA-binding transcriptional regulator [Alloscardovia omnicolens]
MKASISDVAQAAGVSTATVSRVFSHPDRVSNKTRAKVLAVAESLDFYISRSAGVLKSGQAKRIAFLVGSSKIDWFTGRIIEGLNNVFRTAHYDLIIFPITTLEERKEFFDTLPLRGNVDAVVVSSFGISSDEVTRLQDAHLPIVGINVADTLGYTASVSIDDYEGTSIGVRYLKQLGHTHLTYCFEEFERELHFSSWSRVDGFKEACKRENLSFSLVTIPNGDDVFDAVYSQIMTTDAGRSTALFFHQDSLAIPFIFKYRELGMSIPSDISVLGYDNSTFSGEVGLSTIKQKPLDLAMEAAHKALRLIEGDNSAATHDIVPVQLLVRNTTASPTVQ